RQRRVLSPRASQFRESGALDDEMPLRSAAALGHGIARVRPDESLPLEAIERGIDRARGDAAAGSLVDLVANRGAVRALAEAQEREQYDQLEFTEAVA